MSNNVNVKQGRPSARRNGMGGGAADEAGSLHRNGVAAYFAVAGLTGHSVQDAVTKIPSLIGLETADATDDIRCEMTDGSRWFAQAKRTGRRGSELKKTFRQWSKQELRDVDEVVLVSQSFSGSLASAKHVLERERGVSLAKPNARATDDFAKINSDARLIDSELPATIRGKGQFLLCDTGPGGADRRVAVTWLDHHLQHGGGEAAFRVLIQRMQEAAASQQETTLDDWVSWLEQSGHTFVADGAGQPAQRVRSRRLSLAAYRARLAAERDKLDVSRIIPGMSDLHVEDLLEQYELERLDLPQDNGRPESASVKAVAHREARLLVEGLPGMGKSTMLRQVAAVWCTDEEAPTPILLRFGSLAQHVEHRDDVSLRLICELAASTVSEVDSRCVQDALEHELRCGAAVLMIDGLDEAFTKVQIIASGLRQLLGQLPLSTGLIVTTRPSASKFASGLDLERTILRSPRNLESAMRAVLSEGATDHSIPAHEQDAWVDARLKRLAGSRLGSVDRLLEVPLHAILLAGQVAKGDQLSTTVENLLEDVVTERAADWQSHKSAGAPFGDWDDKMNKEILLTVFLEVSHLLSASEEADYKDAYEAASIALTGWGLAPLVLERITRQAMWFWDERAAVLQAVDKLIRARSRRWIELGDALWLKNQPADTVSGWVTEALSDKVRIDGLILAASLDPRVRDVLLEVAITGDSSSQLSAGDVLMRYLENREPAPSERERFLLVFGSLARIAPPKRPAATTRTLELGTAFAAWDYYVAIALLPLAQDLRSSREAILVEAGGLSEKEQWLISALPLLVDADVDEHKDLPEAVRDAIQYFTQLPRPEERPPKRDKLTGAFNFGVSSPGFAGLGRFVLRLARRASQLGEDEVDWLFEAAQHSPLRTYEEITEVLRKGGFRDPRPFKLPFDLETLTTVLKPFTDWSWLLEPLRDLDSGAEHLTKTQRWRHTELMDLVEGLNTDQVSIPQGRNIAEQPAEDIRRWALLIAKTLGLSVGVLAAEATYILDRTKGAIDEKRYSVFCKRRSAPSVDANLLTRGDLEELETLVYSASEWVSDSVTKVLLGLEQVERGHFGQHVTDADQTTPTFGVFNLALVRVVTAQEPEAVVKLLLETPRPACRRAAACWLGVTQTLNPEMDGVRAMCLSDPDWSVRVYAGASIEQAVGAEYWSCSDCDNENPGYEAVPCEECGQARPSARSPRRNSADTA